MSAFAGVVRPAPGPSAADQSRLATAAVALGLPSTPRALGATCQVVGDAPVDAAPDGTLVLSRAPDAAAVYVAQDGRAVGFGSTAEAALAAAGRARRIDAAGLAGVLWRAAPVDAHLPLAGVVGVPAGGRAVVADGVARVERAPWTAPAARVADLETRLVALVRGPSFALLTRGAHASLSLLALRRLAGEGECDAFSVHWPGAPEDTVIEAGRSARALGARHHVVRPDGLDPAAVLERWLASCDLPSVEGLRAVLTEEALARAGAPRVATPLGAAALFGLGEPYATVGRPGWRRLRRSRPPRMLPEAFDVLGQRLLEQRALVRAPAHATQAALALLPVGTRAAISTTGPRPPDGAPHVEGPAVLVASETALVALADGELRSPPPRTWRPFLDPTALALARGLSPRARFGRPGSGGPLRGWLRRAHGWAHRTPAEGFDTTLDRWLHGPWARWLERTLAPERLAAQGVWHPAGVARLVALWRAASGPSVARAVLLVAATVAWIDRVAAEASR